MKPITVHESKRGSPFVVIDRRMCKRDINFTAVTESDPMFLNSVNAEGEEKNMHYITEKLEDCIKEVGTQDIIQIT